MSLDVDFIRSQYPVFADPETARWAMFENAGGSYVPRQVIDRLTHFFQYTKVQPYGMFASSAAAGEAMDAGYACMAGLINADPEALTLGPSTTMNCYVLAQAFRQRMQPGDEIVVTNQDHEANIGCWRRLEADGAVIKEWRIDPRTGELSLDDLKRLVGVRTRLVCFTLCSNIVGTMHDAAAICDIAHEAGAMAVGDGVSFAPHRAMDVTDSGLDVYLFSTYKTFGTHVGVMWVRPAVFENLACQGHFFNDDKPRYRMNPAGPLHAEIAALAGIGAYIDDIHTHHFGDGHAGAHQKAVRVFDLFARHEAQLANRVLDVLKAVPGARIVGQKDAEPGRRAATISVLPDRIKPGEAVRQLVKRRIAVRNGHFYAYRCLEALGIEDPDEGVVRISIVHYNTEKEVERLAEGLKELLVM